ncbi:MAG: 30S ribosomal protein S16 [Polyangiaceae bacterium]
MAVTIRLARGGSKKTPFYRVVVTDTRNSRDGRFLEKIGTFDPAKNGAGLSIDLERFKHWESRGATPSATVLQVVKASSKLAAAAK